MLSVRLPLAVVSGEGGGTVATFLLTRGMGGALLPRSSLIEVLSPSYGLDGTGVDPQLDCVARHGWRWLVEEALAVPGSAVLRWLLRPSQRVLPGRLVWPACGAWPGRLVLPGLARAVLRGGASPVVFEEDPGSVACPGSTPRQ